MLDYTTTPPMLLINTYVKDTDLDLLKDSPATREGYDHSYRIPDLLKLTKYLMHTLSIYYDSHLDHNAPRRKLEDFSESEKRLYMPFAFMLACLDGNAFRTGQLNPIFENPDVAPWPETISYYIPDAAFIMGLNSANEQELRELVANAAA